MWVHKKSNVPNLFAPNRKRHLQSLHRNSIKNREVGPFLREVKFMLIMKEFFGDLEIKIDRMMMLF
jgi:hypothetical protein